jgi:hypothetical protein
MSQKYIIDTSFNWADEMDINQFTILDEEELQAITQLIEDMDYDYVYTAYVGSNEDEELTKRDFQSMLRTARPISDQEAETILRYASQCQSELFGEVAESFYESHPDKLPFKKEEKIMAVPAANNTNEESQWVEFNRTPCIKNIVWKEGMRIKHCWVHAVPYFSIENSLALTDAGNYKPGLHWYESFISTVHKDSEGFYVYPNDDATREKIREFGVDETSIIEEPKK